TVHSFHVAYAAVVLVSSCRTPSHINNLAGCLSSQFDFIARTVPVANSYLCPHQCAFSERSTEHACRLRVVMKSCVAIATLGNRMAKPANRSPTQRLTRRMRMLTALVSLGPLSA